MHTRRIGFTFVELLVAMSVLGALSALALPRLRLLKERAYTATMRADLAELRIAQEAFWAENQFYSMDLDMLDWQSTSDVVITVSTTDPYAGFRAVARHAVLEAVECVTAVGRETVAGTPSGEIVCNAATGTPTATSPGIAE